jgi:hypothetical protein
METKTRKMTLAQYLETAKSHVSAEQVRVWKSKEK